MERGSNKARCTQSEAHAEFIAAAERLWTTLTAWHDAHPEATFDEMEEELGSQGRVLLGELMGLVLRRGDLGAEAEALRCERCGREMVFKGYPTKTVHGLKVDVRLPRAYYVLPPLPGWGFPPGPAVEIAS